MTRLNIVSELVNRLLPSIKWHNARAGNHVQLALLWPSMPCHYRFHVYINFFFKLSYIQGHRQYRIGDFFLPSVRSLSRVATICHNLKRVLQIFDRQHYQWNAAQEIDIHIRDNDEVSMVNKKLQDGCLALLSLRDPRIIIVNQTRTCTHTHARAHARTPTHTTL